MRYKFKISEVSSVQIPDDWEKCTKPHLSLDSVLEFGQGGVLMIGFGDNAQYLASVLIKKVHKLLCNDIANNYWALIPPGIMKNIPFIKEDCRDLNYAELKEYKTLILSRLCCKEDASLVKNLMSAGLWDSFENIIAEFCNTPEHYKGAENDYQPVINNASECREILDKKGYNTKVCFCDFSSSIHPILYASKKQLPAKTKIKLEIKKIQPIY